MASRAELLRQQQAQAAARKRTADAQRQAQYDANHRSAARGGTGGQQATRANRQTVSGEGLRIKLDPLPGLTPKGLLRPTGEYFQCPPLEEFTTEYAHTHNDYDTVNAGQMSRKGGRQLIACSFDTLVVDWGAYTLVDQTVELENFSAMLRRLCFKGAPFLMTAAHQIPSRGYHRFSLTLAGPELQMAATLRNLRVSEKAGEGDARYLNVSFTEYRDPLVTERGLGARAEKGDSKLPVNNGKITKQGAYVYTAEGGRRVTVNGKLRTFGGLTVYPVTLADLAQHFYKNPNQAKLIAKANHITGWGRNSVLLEHPRWRRGGKLKIPKRPKKR